MKTKVKAPVAPVQPAKPVQSTRQTRSTNEKAGTTASARKPATTVPQQKLSTRTRHLSGSRDSKKENEPKKESFHSRKVIIQ